MTTYLNATDPLGRKPPSFGIGQFLFVLVLAGSALLKYRKSPYWRIPARSVRHILRHALLDLNDLVGQLIPVIPSTMHQECRLCGGSASPASRGCPLITDPYELRHQKIKFSRLGAPQNSIGLCSTLCIPGCTKKDDHHTEFHPHHQADRAQLPQIDSPRTRTRNLFQAFRRACLIRSGVMGN